MHMLFNGRVPILTFARTQVNITEHESMVGRCIQPGLLDLSGPALQEKYTKAPVTSLVRRHLKVPKKHPPY